jgi:hypothetical protein
VFGKKRAAISGASSKENQAASPSDNGSTVFWPQDYLGPDLPEARIVTYGYDANIPTILNVTADGSIFKISQNLVTRFELFGQGYRRHSHHIYLIL